MVARERPAKPGRQLLSPLWMSFAVDGIANVYINALTGTVTTTKPLAPADPLLRGGVLGDASASPVHGKGHCEL